MYSVDLENGQYVCNSDLLPVRVRLGDFLGMCVNAVSGVESPRDLRILSKVKLRNGLIQSGGCL